MLSNSNVAERDGNVFTGLGVYWRAFSTKAAVRTRDSGINGSAYQPLMEAIYVADCDLRRLEGVSGRQKVARMISMTTANCRRRSSFVSSRTLTLLTPSRRHGQGWAVLLSRASDNGALRVLPVRR